MLLPLATRNFRLYWIGRTISVAGDQFQTVALAVTALDVTHSASGLGTVLMVQAVPRAVLMLFGGAATDRFRARTVMLVSDALQMLIVATLAVLAWRGALTLWELAAYAALSGTVYAFFLPASNTIVPDLVPRDRVLQANALTNTAFNLSLFLMPPLAGAVVARYGAGPAFSINAVSFLGSVGTLYLVRVPNVATRPGGAVSPFRQIGRSIAAARRDTPTWLTIGLAVFYCFGFQGATAVGIPALAKLTLGAGDPGVGLLYGARGAGALIGCLLVANLGGRKGLLGCGAILGISVTVAAGGLAPTLWSAAAVFALSGLFGASVGTIFFSLVQTRAPDEDRGGIMALVTLAIFGLSPLAYGLAGLAAAALNPRAVLVAGGLLMAIAGIWGLSNQEMRAAD